MCALLSEFINQKLRVGIVLFRKYITDYYYTHANES